MAMSRDERLKMQKVLERFVESNEPTKGNVAVFVDEQGTFLYSGIISEWPMIIATDREWGKVMELDATKEPFVGKKVRFFSPFTGD
jgi:hypothetical protein